MDRYICVHGHFYQPPRENPWIDAVEAQDSARPHHDWNERITRECYAPNGAARILDPQGRIVRIVNNYARISFNLGPTLLAWMQEGAPETYRAVLDADRESRARFSGHGSAMAQAYNHMIMPLADARDRATQVRWGIRDFEHRFGRRPEGMWLPETAVDLPTLEALAEHGIRFTVLAPHQAARVRRLGARAWQRVGGGIDPSMAYRVRLRGGRGLNVFFYDGPISHAVAFERLLDDGGGFARRLEDGFDPRRTWPQLVNIATDGETYGHHHRHGDMALAYALQQIEAQGRAELTNYGEFLALHPPTHEVEIVERSSWSCAHGVERWRADCGCSSGGHPGWRQAWRGPLREALDRLRDAAAAAFESRAARLLRDPWAARDAYVDVVLDRSPENVDRFLDEQGSRRLDADRRVEALKLLELQRHAMLMYTSCGWFFDEVSGLETVQVLQYAGRVVQLAEELFGGGMWEAGLLADLARAPSNIPEYRDGAEVYRRFVAPAAIDLPKVGAHYAVSSILDPEQEATRLYCYDVRREAWRRLTAGQSAVAVGRVHVASRITRESADLAFAVLHFGGQNLTAAVRPYRGEDEYGAMEQGVAGAFQRADLAEVIRLIDRYFDRKTVTPRLLFRDQQRRIVARLLDAAVSEAEALYRQIYDRHATLMALLRDLGVAQPRALATAAEIMLDGELQRALAGPEPRRERVVALLDEAAALSIHLDDPGLGYTVQKLAEARADELAAQPGSLERLADLRDAVDLGLTPPLQADLWRVQNVYYHLLRTVGPARRAAAEAGDAAAREWMRAFTALGELLQVAVPS